MNRIDVQHGRALEEHRERYTGRDSLRRSIATGTNEALGHRLDNEDMHGYWLAVARDVLHGRALEDHERYLLSRS